MINIIHWLLFKIVWVLCQIWLAAESLVNGFIRYVYIPTFHSNLTPSKIVKDLAAFDKKPCQELSFVFEIRSSKSSDLKVSAMKIVRYGRIVEEAINPTSLNCYLDVSFIRQSQKEQLREIVQNILKDEKSRIKLLFQSDFKYKDKISSEKSKTTPLVIVFSSYPSILGLHPSYLIGAQIAFRPQLLKSTDYDLYSSLQNYATSEQRKGK